MRRLDSPFIKNVSIKNVNLAIVVTCVVLQALHANACTVMRLKINGRLVVARNHDWPFGEAIVITNQRGIEKTSLAPIKPARWVSKYGSVSFCQFGREIPFAGMNERGLTVDLLHLREAEFPDPATVDADPDLTAVNAIQWVQFQLDTAETVAEVVASLETVVPIPMLPSVERVHYFITDPSGDVAVIEFIGGRAVIRHGETYATETGEPEPAICSLANSTWDDCQITPRQDFSQTRYARGVRAVQTASRLPEDIDPVDHATGCLQNVLQGHTQWNLVYLPEEHRIHFRTRNAFQPRWIDLDDMDFATDAVPRVIDIDAKVTGDVSAQMHDVTPEDNARIVNHAFDRTVPTAVPRMLIKQLLLDYPDNLTAPSALPAEAVR